MKPKLTISLLEHPISANEVLFQGEIIDNHQGINMTNSGRRLKYIVKVGCNKDWCVYCHWAENTFAYVTSQGDKVISRANIENILEIDDEVWARYRH